MLEPEWIFGTCGVVGALGAYTVKLSMSLGSEKRARETDSKVIEKLAAKNEDLERRVNTLEQFEAADTARESARAGEMARIYETLGKLEVGIREVNAKMTEISIQLAGMKKE